MKNYLFFKNKSYIFFLIFIIGGLITGQGIYKYNRSHPIALAIDAEVDRGGNLLIYVNDETKPPYVFSFTAGHREIYRCEDIPRIVNRIRIDFLTDSPTNAKIYELSFIRKGEKIIQITGDDLAKWQLIDVYLARAGNGLLQLQGTADHFIIFQDVDYVLSKTINRVIKLFNNSLWIKNVARFLASSQNWDILIILFGLVMIIISGFKNPYYFTFYPCLIFVYIFWMGNTIMKFNFGDLGGPPSVQYAVGMASYLGYSKSVEVLLFCTVILATILIVFVFLVIDYYKYRSDNFQVNKDKVVVQAKPTSLFLLFVLIFLPAVLAFPPLRQSYDSLPYIQHVAQWDNMNMLAWSWEAWMGWLPFKDFWFPYVSFTSVTSSLPWDMFNYYSHNIIVLAAFAISIYFLVDKNKLWSVLILGIALFLIENNYIRNAPRYFMALDYVLLFLVLQKERSTYIHYVFYGILIGFLSMSDPLQIVYAGCPIIILCVIFFLNATDIDQRKVYLKKIMLVGGVLFFSFLIYAVLLWRKGQLDGLLHFYGHLKTQSVSCAIPSGLRDWFKLIPRPNQIFAYGIVFFIAYGLYLTIAKKTYVSYHGGKVLLSTGLLSFMFFQKYIIRPYEPMDFIGVEVIGGLLYLYYWSRYWNYKQKYAGIFLFAFLIGFGQTQWFSIGQRYFNRIPRLFEDLKIVKGDVKNMNRQIGSLFSIDNFRNFRGANEFYKYYNEVIKLNPQNTFYVLGDDSFFYILAKQKPPYYITFYNGSNIFNQNVIVSWLENNEVPFVIWNPDFKNFDTVPHLVRVPLIFNYIIQYYEPFGGFSTYEVLKRKIPTDCYVDIEFWRSRLGDTIDLGCLPGISNIYKLGDCQSSEFLNCHEFLKLKILGDKITQKRTIAVKVGGYLFKIMFQENGKNDTYYIYLDRIWFWGCLKKAGFKPELVPDQDANVDFEILYKIPDDNILY